MKRLLLFLVLVVAALVGVTYWYRHVHASGSSGVEFTVTPTEYGPISETVSATGRLEPQEVLVVGSSLSGRVIEIAADFNQVVQEGDVLLRLDDSLARQDLKLAQVGVRMARAGLTEAKAKREAAQHALDRQRQLPDNVGRKLDLQSAEEMLHAAEAGVEAAVAQVTKAEEAQQRAELGLRLTTVRVPIIERASSSSAVATVREASPEDGSSTTASPDRPRRKFLLLERKVELNQQIGPPVSARLFVLAGSLAPSTADVRQRGSVAAVGPGPLPVAPSLSSEPARPLAQMRLHAQVAEGDISKVHVGQDVDFTVSTYAAEDRHFHGAVAEVHLVPSTVQGAVYYDALIDVPNELDGQDHSWRLRPGMMASLDIIQRRHEHAWKLPIAALTFQLDEQYQSKAARARVARGPTGQSSDEWKTVWILDKNQGPWPIFVRLGGVGPSGQPAIHDSQFHEVLEWDPELNPKPEAGQPATYPRVILGQPSPKGGLFRSSPIRF